MKRLHQYLTESEHVYRYTIKIAGDVDAKFLDLLKINLKKFDPVQISEPKTTPIQADPYGFPDLKNQSVTIIKAEFRYPATEPQIQQMAQLLGYNVNQVRVVTTSYDDSINDESQQYANQSKEKPLLTQPALADNGKEASKEYANQYLDRVLPKEPSIAIPYASKPTATALNKSREGVQNKSPMTNIKRPPKPATGATK